MDFSFYPYERTISSNNSLDNLTTNVQRTTPISKKQKMTSKNSDYTPEDRFNELLRFINNKTKEEVTIYIEKNEISLQFWGWELVILKSGDYFPNDTSGG